MTEKREIGVFETFKHLPYISYPIEASPLILRMFWQCLELTNTREEIRGNQRKSKDIRENRRKSEEIREIRGNQRI